MIFSYHAVPTEEEMFFISRPLQRLLRLIFSVFAYARQFFT